jgi:hypothetical protein
MRRLERTKMTYRRPLIGVAALSVALLGGCGQAAAPAASSQPVASVAASGSTIPAVSTAASGGNSAGCVQGGVAKDVNGVQTKEFCGPAKATIMVGGQTLTIAGGECEASGSSFVVNIGTFNGEKLNPREDYFGIYIETSDNSPMTEGPHTGGMLAGNVGSTDFTMGTSGTITLKNGLSAGDFAGKAFGGGDITGSFSCT